MRTLRSIVLILIALGIAGCGRSQSTGTPADHPEATPKTFAAAEAHAYLGEHPEALVLDLREPAEWDDDLGHIVGARQIPLGSLAGRLLLALESGPPPGQRAR